MPRAILLSLALGLLACGGARPATPVPERTTVERLYPMRMGSIWTYDVDTGQDLATLAITRVTANDGRHVEVSSGGDPIRYELKPEGLFRSDRAGYLLKPPFAKGATWEAGGGAKAEITATDRSMETMAGAFTGCLEVNETGGANGKVVRTVYCPDVGPVEIESSMHMGLSGQTARVLAKLRGYDFSATVVNP
jgi:hypothetical protein